MVLASADLGGARVTGQRYFTDRDFPSTVSYVREFENGRVGATPLAVVRSQAEVGTNARTTAAFLVALRRVFASDRGRALLAAALERDAGPEALVSNVRVGRPRSLGVGPGSFDVHATVRLLRERIDLHVAVFAVERVLGTVTAVGNLGARVPLAVITRLARVQFVRTALEVVPQNLALPAVSGTPVLRAALTASPGRWTGNPRSFAYQWQRCDESAAACAPIPGATARTYVVTDADVGSTIRVAVTARGLLRSDPAVSAATAVALVFIDTFDAPTSSAWSMWTTGSGPRIVRTNGQLELTLPAATSLAAEGYAMASAEMTCRLTGDFDMQVDYRLLSGLLPVEGVTVSLDASEFTGSAFSGVHGMFVHNAGGNNHGIATHFPGSNSFVPDSAVSGTLRLVRTTRGGVTTVTASRVTGQPWSFTSQPYLPPTSQAANLHLFTNLGPLPTEIRVAFDNFRITSGALSCP
jgi:hypothetical protein